MSSRAGKMQLFFARPIYKSIQTGRISVDKEAAEASDSEKYHFAYAKRHLFLKTCTPLSENTTFQIHGRYRKCLTKPSQFELNKILYRRRALPDTIPKERHSDLEGSGPESHN